MPRKPDSLFARIRQILESARSRVARSVNTTQVVANWLIGREIVVDEQSGSLRATYGSKLLLDLSHRLTKTYGRGYSPDNLEAFRAFYLGYPRLISETPSRKLMDVTKSETSSRKSMPDSPGSIDPIGHALRGQFASDTPHITIRHTPGGESWSPGLLHPNLSWSLYRQLLKVDSPDARAFYEIEAIQQCWSARELERQIASLLFERLAKSRDKAGVLRLATKGHEIASPIDVFKDPVVIEFLGLPESARLAESDVEQALLDQLQTFLLELGKGFAFVARQQRLTLDGDHFYIDLVFYHVVLKCSILLDLLCGRPHKRSMTT